MSTYVARIRVALRKAGTLFELPGEDGSYRLEIAPEALDYKIFCTAVGQARATARAGDDVQAAALLRKALALWRGDPLEDLNTERATNWRRVAIRDDWLPANNALLDSLHRLGDFEGMLHLLKAIQVEHDQDLLLAKRHLQALYSLDRKEEAIEYLYDFYRRARAASHDIRADELRGYHNELIRPVRRSVSAVHGDSRPAPRNLPYDVDGFAGRRDLLADLDNLVVGSRKSRVIALDGLPGVGKTALAVHWAHRMRDRFPDGAWFVNLNGFGEGPVIDENEVVAELLEAFQAAADCPPTPVARRAKLREVLDGRQMLVVLDNAHDAEHVQSLIPLLAGSVVVVTSRVRLSGLALAHTARGFTVLPLDGDLAASWLRERIGGRALADPESLARLASLAGGLPLALGIIGEYVAAQQGKPLRDFVAQLRERRAVLGLGDNGTRTVMSLRAVFDCSYRDLPPEQKRLFRLLGTYPGLDFPPHVAAALVGVPPARVRDQLDGLVWARLLEAHEDDRYRFHDLLRTYASERAEVEESAEERERAAVRLVDWFLHTCHHADRKLFSYRESVPMTALADGVEPLDFADEDAAMNWCVRERAEVAGVIDYASSVGLHEHVWRLVPAVGEVMMRQGFKDEVLQSLRAAVFSARKAANRYAESGILANLGFAYSRFHDHEEADRCFRRAYDLAVEVDDRIGVATVLRNMAERAAVVGDHTRAMEMFGRALTIARDTNNFDTEAGVLHRMGEALRRRGRLDEALTHLHLAWGIRERIGDADGRGTTLARIAAVHLEKGDHHGALTFAHQAIVELARTRHFGLEGEAAATAATVHRNLGNLEDAAFHARRAVELSRTARDPLGQAAAQDLLGQVMWRQGSHREARECWEMACSLYADLGDSRSDSIRLHLDEPPDDKADSA
ncbi:tetratricopeptide repeat protein [Umezawaea endophytica]|uniref:Tetratricopeptide repeat protein n=1 Tax=Umezawaea endophytica TaxID=1654476 RepID=A0A9X2VV62_9PSEU|nr:tetratricopeptide repeat protein [Umezawaea endophytica]MCS7483259.1 tetratricopeptide repeat protein [Umezawaea endophytica]